VGEVSVPTVAPALSNAIFRTHRYPHPSVADVSHDPDLLAREDKHDGRSNNYASLNGPTSCLDRCISPRQTDAKFFTRPVRDVPVRALQ